MNMKYNYLTEQKKQQLISLRRELHEYPEQGFCEYRTSEKIAGILEKLGYEVKLGSEVMKPEARMGVPNSEILKEAEERALSEGMDPLKLEKMRGGRTGVIGILRTDKPEEQAQAGTEPPKVIALRFDIDALPVEEKTGLEFSSKHLKTMHACGHDGHTAVGLMVAQILAENLVGRQTEVEPQNRAGHPYEIRLIFQPAEEGVRGAKAIAENGWLDDVDVFLSGHIGLGCTPVGRIQACTDGFLATSKLNFTFIGKAAHAAKNPEDGRNALLAAAEFTVVAAEIPTAVEAQTITVGAPGKGLLNVGKLISGSARNIIADKAYLELETRGETSEINAQIEAEAQRKAEEIAAKYGVTVQIEQAGASVTAKSSPELVERLKTVAEGMEIGEVYQTRGTMPASEDAAILMECVQSHGGQAAYFLFGTKLAGDHHQSTFDFDEETLSVMAEFMAEAVLSLPI